MNAKWQIPRNWIQWDAKVSSKKAGSDNAPQLVVHFAPSAEASRSKFSKPDQVFRKVSLGHAVDTLFELHEVLSADTKMFMHVLTVKSVDFSKLSESRAGDVQQSSLGKLRDLFGLVFSVVFSRGKESASKGYRVGFVTTSGTSDPFLCDFVEAFFCALSVWGYQYKGSVWEIKGSNCKVHGLTGSADLSAAKRGVLKGESINLSRFLVDMPPNLLNPKTFCEYASDLLSKRDGVKIEIWTTERLKKEKMGLHLAVGSAADIGPQLLRVSVVPRAKAKKEMPKKLALVGKGITFDSGGLDLKPSSNMRLMKKDMGGAAAVMGAVWFLANLRSEERPARAVEAFVPLAENAVSGGAFRPSDVVVSRSGLTVEIHNTDAEGRLVLADSLSLAVEDPQIGEIINVATLTGAIKVALGSEVAGFFSNDDELAMRLQSAFAKAGDLVWRMPLVSLYKKHLQTPFADLVNAHDGFGGAINAALFLEAFVGKKPWAHFDIYAWMDKSSSLFAEPGGSGQGALGLIEFLRS